VGIHEINGPIKSEFRQNLSACATRRAKRFFQISRNCYTQELFVTVADGADDGGSLGADGESVRSVFHVAAAENFPGFRQQRRSHVEFAVGAMSIFPLLARDLNEFFLLLLGDFGWRHICCFANGFSAVFLSIRCFFRSNFWPRFFLCLRSSRKRKSQKYCKRSVFSKTKKRQKQKKK